ncbi:hypothetical protein [Paenibacillus odorifer]|uniref:hypothetical protein n=1 Tax=Paenibacillus odorifer TaxID=189426 RepID=UPI0004F90D72|nr:hypothetical protein [Paenibacillus odorifer]AIQ73003.1 hypothetical protein PODO_06900 [Paenibacillus odorifer]
MSDSKILRRVKLTRQNKDLCIMQLKETAEGYTVSLSDNANTEDVDLINTITQEMKSSKEYEDKIAFWEDLLIALKNRDITYRELPAYDIKLAIQLDMKTGEKLVTYEKNTEVKDEPDTIARKVAGALSKVFSEYGIDTVKKIEKALSQNHIDEAYIYLEEGKKEGLLNFSTKDTRIKLLQAIQKFSTNILTPEKRKELLETKFLLGESTGIFSILYDDASQYIKEFGDQADPGLIRNLWLLMANAASEQGKTELAYNLYQKVLYESTDDARTNAWAHRGLAVTLGYENPDAIYHESMAADAFLLSGQKHMYASSKSLLAEYTKMNDPRKAISLLEEAINVFNADAPHLKDRIAELLLSKAMIHHLCGENDAALKAAERSIELRGESGQFGNESKIIASLNAAIQFEETLKSDGTQQILKNNYEARISELETVIFDEDKLPYSLRKRLSNALADKDSAELEQMKQEVLKRGNSEIVASYWIALVIARKDANIKDNLELLENAWAEANKPNVRKELRASVCSMFAEIYKENGMDEKALEWYEKALVLNPFFWTNRQNYAALLWKNEKWKDAVIFFEEQRKRFGDLPSILFAYGRSLVEFGESGKAIPILRLAQKKNPDAEYIQEYINKALDSLDGDIQTKSPPQSATISVEAVTITSLEKCLIDFIGFIQNDKRMSFWKYDPVQKKHKWVSSPEQHGQNLLHTFLKSRFGHNVEAIEEVSTGAGRIDIYLRFRSGLKTILELKMCGGGGYSEGYAIEGFKQLTHYLENKQTYLGYLVVFDGRMRDYGKGIQSQYSYEKCTIRSFVADVRPEVK